jgi:type IV pilus assembly protein PilM
MGILKWPTRSPIGVDLGEHSIKAVQLNRRGTRWVLGAAANFPRKTAGGKLEPAEIDRLLGVLERAGFKGTSAVLAAPRGDLMSGMLELPPRTPGLPIDQIARMEFSRVHKCEAAGFQLSYWDLPEPARASKATHVMAVGYKHSAADEFLDTIESAGLNVIALDSNASALTRACIPLACSATTAILDLGYSEASLALSQAGLLTYERRMTEAGTKRLTESLRTQLDLTDDEINYVAWDGGFGEPGDRRGAEVFTDARRYIGAHFAPLIHELKLTFSYTEHQYPQAPVKLLLIAGGGAKIPGIAGHLQAALGIDVRVANPADVVACSTDLLDRATQTLLTAVGLAQFEEA